MSFGKRSIVTEQILRIAKGSTVINLALGFIFNIKRAFENGKRTRFYRNRIIRSYVYSFAVLNGKFRSIFHEIACITNAAAAEHRRNGITASQTALIRFKSFPRNRRSVIHVLYRSRRNGNRTRSKGNIARLRSNCITVCNVFSVRIVNTNKVFYGRNTNLITG